MRPSRELKGLVLECYREWSQADPSYVDVYSDSEHVTLIGTDPAEWLRGGRQIKAIFRQQAADLGKFDLLPGELYSVVHGNVGWVVDNPTLTFPDGTVLKTRSTIIFVREHEEWQCVHWHMSLGASNQEVIGKNLTTAMEAIAEWAEEARPDLTDSTSAQGTVTIVFTDVEGSTATNEALGDDRFVPLLLRYHDIVQRCTQAENGVVVKSQGDGFMLAFPSARGAAACMIDVQRQTTSETPILIRMGLHTGEPVRHKHDFFGRDVAYAARLGAAARGGEILVSELVRSLVEPSGSVTFEGPRLLDLKGFDGLQPVHAINWSGSK